MCYFKGFDMAFIRASVHPSDRPTVHQVLLSTPRSFEALDSKIAALPIDQRLAVIELEWGFRIMCDTSLPRYAWAPQPQKCLRSTFVFQLYFDVDRDLGLRDATHLGGAALARLLAVPLETVTPLVHRTVVQFGNRVRILFSESGKSKPAGKQKQT